MAEEYKDLVCTVVNFTDPAQVEEAASSVDTGYVELRLDLVECDVLSWVEGRLPELVDALHSRGVRVIATLRSREEGGKYSGDPSYKVAILKSAADAGADYVDVELGFGMAHEVIEYVKSRGTQVIVSYHNFNSTPGPEALSGLVHRALSLGGDIAKVVTKAETMIDNIRVLRLNTANYRKVIAFAMGTLGVVSRILAPLCGAPFTYAYHDAGVPAAPGQLSVSEVLELISLFKGCFKK